MSQFVESVEKRRGKREWVVVRNAEGSFINGYWRHRATSKNGDTSPKSRRDGDRRACPKRSQAPRVF